MFDFTEMHFWLLATAIIFTFVGMWMVRSSSSDAYSLIIEATIDRLIKDGYIKSRVNENGEVELLKYNEE